MHDNYARDLTYTSEPALGGGIAAGAGGVQLADSVIASNYTAGAQTMSGTQVFTSPNSGGAIHSGTSISVTGSTITANASSGPVVVADHDYGVIDVRASLISGNEGSGMLSAARIGLENATVAYNTAGALIFANKSIDFANSTVAENPCTRAVYAHDGGTLDSTIISNPATTVQLAAYDIGHFLGGSHNLVFSNAAGKPPPVDTLFVDPELTPLADHGGPTKTMGLAAGSPAIDAGANPDSLAYDQRGTGFARLVGTGVDIGAYETRPALLTIAPTSVDFGTVAVGATSPPRSVTILNAGGGNLQVTAIDAPVAPFHAAGGTCGPVPINLAGNATCTVTFTFTMTDPGGGAAMQSLAVTSNAGNAVIQLHGVGGDDSIFVDGFEQ